MKRCPSCKFIYLDTDEVCDFDGTRLVLVDEKDLDESVAGESAGVVPQPPVSIKGGRTVALAALVGLGLGVVFFVVYLAAARRSQPLAQTVQPAVQLATPSQPESSPTSTPSPSPLPSPDSEPSLSATERRSASPERGSIRTTVSRNPVSTSTQTGPQTGVLIRLTNGALIEADEVWRTREGVWYRRKGLVTLVKASQVKAIEKSSRRQ